MIGETEPFVSRRQEVLKMSKVIVIREWDSDVFHRRVLEMEAEGYVAQLESYSITPEMNPETGEIIHLRTIDLCKPEAEKRQDSLG